MQPAAPDNRNWMLAAAAIVLAGLWLRWRMFSPFEISHADEIMQYLEQARRLATGDGIVPWEYRYGIRNGLIAQLLAVPWWLGAKLAPGTLAPMLAVRWSFVALTLLALPAAWKLGAQSGRAQALLALLVAALWYESVLFSELLLSEGLATPLLVLAAALLLGDAPSRRALRLAGLLLGLGVIVRLQYAPFAAVLALGALGRNWRGWGQLLIGGGAAALIGGLSDAAMGHEPFAWVWQNIAFNMQQGRAARFGESGPLEYLRLLWLHLGPAAVLIVAAALAAPRRYRPLLAALAVNIAFHSLIAHKEYRFIWLSTFLIVVLGAIGMVSLTQRLMAARGQALGAPMLAGLGALWLAFSFAAEAETGGAQAMRGGAPIPLAALDAVRSDAPVCGIALPDQWRAHLVPALLPSPVPLYVAPKEMLDRDAPLPPRIAGAANVLLAERLPHGAQGYRLLSCERNSVFKACAWLRVGGCTAAPEWSYQAALRREDL